MREIKFRGQRFDNKEWIYGYYSVFNGNHAIMPESGLWLKIIPESIGEYTGLKDKNGNEIYEGDILSTKRTITGLPTKNGKAIEYFSGDYSGAVTRMWDELMVVEFKHTDMEISFSLPQGSTYQERNRPLQWEIVGNIYENPELLNNEADSKVNKLKNK